MEFLVRNDIPDFLIVVLEPSDVSAIAEERPEMNTSPEVISDFGIVKLLD